MLKQKEVYIVYLIEIDDENYVDNSSHLHSVHKTWDNAEKELEEQVNLLVNKYKGKHLQGYEKDETEEIINEYCYIRTEEIKD
jgi:hypothetical protein